MTHRYSYCSGCWLNKRWHASTARVCSDSHKIRKMKQRLDQMILCYRQQHLPSTTSQKRTRTPHTPRVPSKWNVAAGRLEMAKEMNDECRLSSAECEWETLMFTQTSAVSSITHHFFGGQCSRYDIASAVAVVVVRFSFGLANSPFSRQLKCIFCSIFVYIFFFSNLRLLWSVLVASVM